MSIDDIIPSVLKVTAKENVDIQKDLATEDPDNPTTLEALLNETIKEENKSEEEKDQSASG